MWGGGVFEEPIDKFVAQIKYQGRTEVKGVGVGVFLRNPSISFGLSVKVHIKILVFQ